MNYIIYNNSYILTKTGYYLIEDIDITNEIEIWNKDHWFFVKIIKYIHTEEIHKSYKILLSDGCELLCSETQKLNIIELDKSNLSKKINNIKIENIKVNDLLNSYNFPIIDGKENILYPYTHGYYCGCMNKTDGFEKLLKFESNLIYINLIDEKQNLKSKIKITGKYTINKLKNISTGLLKVDMNKNITAPINGNIKDKLTWLSGLIDNNGFITKLCDAKYLNISIISKKFAMEIKLLFNTLGINPNMFLNSGIRKFKTNSGEINKVIKHFWIISLNSEDTNKIFLKSEFDLKLFYLKYDKSFYSIEQDIDRYISVKKITKLQQPKDSYIIKNTKSCILNGIQILC